MYTVYSSWLSESVTVRITAMTHYEEMTDFKTFGLKLVFVVVGKADAGLG